MFAKVFTAKLLMIAIHNDNDKLWTQQLTKNVSSNTKEWHTFFGISFCYEHLFAHLISDSKTFALNQKSIAIKTYKAGAMKHKETGYQLFKDYHVKRVKFLPGSGTKCFCSSIVQASFKSATNYSASVCLHK